MTTSTGFVMTLANSIIGVGVLAMPFCFKQCGILLGVLLLLAGNTLTRLSCYFLVKSAVMGRGRCFEHVAVHAFGLAGKVFVELGVVGFMMGSSIAYFVVMGDLAPKIVAKLFLVENNDNLRSLVLVVAGFFVILPLSLLRNIESLAAISTITMLFYMLLAFKILTESLTHLAAADWTPYVQYWRPEGILQCFPIFAMALSCQTQLFEILEVIPNPTVEKMNGVVRSAVGLCTFLYVAVGFFGYVAYVREPFSGNILLSFSHSTSSDLIQLGFVLSIAVSFPIAVFPCRASINSLLFKRANQYHDLPLQTTFIPESRFKWLTVCIVSFALCTALLIPSIEFVLGFVGSTMGVGTCVLFPSAAFVRISGKQTTERLVAKMMVGLAVVLMILGTYANLDSLSERNVIVPKIVDLPSNKLIPNVVGPALDKPLPEKQPVIEDPPKVNEPNLKEVPPIESEKRVEPPIPMAPNIVEKKAEKPFEPPPKPIDNINPPNGKEDKRLEKSLPLEVADKKPKEVSVSPADEVLAQIPKKSESIHQDAIAKEEKEIKESDNKQKSEGIKNEELLKKLAEHKEEQKKLLEEQQSILEEIKSRDAEAKPIKPKKFADGIDKIQEVIDDLKERKQVIDKKKEEKIDEDKKKEAEKKASSEKIKTASEELVLPQIKIVKNPDPKPKVNSDLEKPSIPILLQKVNKSMNAAAVGRDILEEKVEPHLEREKRDAEDESCPKNEKTVIEVTDSPLEEKGIKNLEKISIPEEQLLPLDKPKDEADKLVRLVESKNKIEREMK